MRIFISTIMTLALQIVLIIGSSADNPKPNPRLFQEIEGTWGWKSIPESSCERNPHTISFSDNDKKMTVKHTKTGSETTYQVLYAEGNRVTMLIDGEERRTDFGDRVIWVLILNNQNTYQWRRMDWKPKTHTTENIRCKAR